MQYWNVFYQQVELIFFIFDVKKERLHDSFNFSDLWPNWHHSSGSKYKSGNDADGDIGQVSAMLLSRFILMLSVSFTIGFENAFGRSGNFRNVFSRFGDYRSGLNRQQNNQQCDPNKV